MIIISLVLSSNATKIVPNKLYDCIILQALSHASIACHIKLTVDWVPASDLEDETENEVIILQKNAYMLILVSMLHYCSGC